MSKMPEKIYAAISKHGSHYWATQLHEELNKTNVCGNPQEQYTHTQQLIEWLEGREKYTNFAEPSFFEGYNQAIDEVIAKLRGDE